LDRTGYSLDVSTGQRRYGGPPPNWDKPQPGPGHEVKYSAIFSFLSVKLIHIIEIWYHTE